jgi:hypothetical protein
MYHAIGDRQIDLKAAFTTRNPSAGAARWNQTDTCAHQEAT